MQLSRDDRFSSVDRPRSCKRGAAFGFYGRASSRVLLLRCDAGVVGDKAVRRVGLCFMWSVLVDVR